MNMTDYEGYLKMRLTPKRFEHSLGVMGVMQELAPVYNLDPSQARLAGLLHDVAKEFPETEWMSLLRLDEGLFRDSKEYDYDHYLHGPVGVIVLQRDLQITDQAVLEAITAHGYYGPWEAFHRPLSWCLRFADILEPGRDWRNNRWLGDLISPFRDAVYGGRLMDAALMIVPRMIQWYSAEGVSIHPNIQRVASGVSLKN